MATAASAAQAESGVGTTALARMQLILDTDAGDEQVIRERRFGDAVTARAWLEQLARAVEECSEVQEIAVLTEQWSSRVAWQRAGTRRRTVTVQVGRRLSNGAITWSDPLPASPKAGSSHAR